MSAYTNNPFPYLSKYLRSLAFSVLCLVCPFIFGADEVLTWSGSSLAGSGGTNTSAGSAVAVDGDTFHAGSLFSKDNKIQTENKKHDSDGYWEVFSGTQDANATNATNTARAEFPFTVASGYSFTISSVSFKFEQGGGGGPAVHVFIVQGTTSTWLGYATAGTLSYTPSSLTLNPGAAKLVFVLGVTSNFSNGRQFKFSNISINGTSTAASTTPDCAAATLPTLTNQSVTNASDFTAWNATPTNSSALSGLTIAYDWKKGSAHVATTASYTPTEAGTYTVNVTTSGSDCGSKTVSSTVTASVEGTTPDPSDDPSSDDCDIYFFYSQLSAPATPPTNNENNFFSNTPSGGSTFTATIVIDGVTYTTARRYGNNSNICSFTVPEGKTATFYALINGSSGRVLNTTLDGEAYAEGSGISVASQPSTVTLEDLSAGTYRMTTSGNVGLGLVAVKLCDACTESKPTITTPTGTVLCSGSGVTLSASGYESGATLQWYKGDAPISGATSPNYQPTEAGNYSIRATKTCTASSEAITVTEATIPTSVSISASSSTVNVGNSTTLTASVSEGVNYRWYVGLLNDFATATLQSGETGRTFNYTPANVGIRYVFVEVTACGTSVHSDAVAIEADNNKCYVIGTNANGLKINNTTPYNWLNGDSNVEAALYGPTSTQISSSTSNTCSGAARRYLMSTFVIQINNTDVQVLTLLAQVSGERTLSDIKVGNTIDEATLLTAGVDYTAPSKISPSDCREFEIDFANGISAGSYILVHFSGDVRLSGFCVQGETCERNPEGSFAWSTDSGTATYEGGIISVPTLTNTTGNGNIIYGSTNAAVATIDATTGAITITGVGTTEITAYLPADNGKCEETAKYTLTVTCAANDPTPRIFSTGTSLTCAGSVTLTVKNGDTEYSAAQEAAMTVLWRKNGTAHQTLSGSGCTSITVAESGEYDAVVTINCPVATDNKINIASTIIEPEVKPLVKFQYLHTASTDYENRVPQRQIRHLFHITPASTEYLVTAKHISAANVETDLGNDNSWVYTGTADTVLADYPLLRAQLTAKGITLGVGDVIRVTLTPRDACHDFNSTFNNSLDIRVVHENTTTLAYVVSGTKEGDFLDDINTGNIDPLFSHLNAMTNADGSAKYLATAVNGYAKLIDKSSKTLNHIMYEPFDEVLCTDYLKNQGGSPDHVEAFADLVDTKPILTLKAHMVGLNKWTALGFTASASVPNPSLKSMEVMCYAHPMFYGIEGFSSANPILEMLSNVKDKKGMQGLKLTDASKFLIIATDPGNAQGVTTCFERQLNINARFMVISIYEGATQYITEKGEQVIDRVLQYLMQVDPTQVSDCAIVFKGQGSGDKTAWDDPENWLPNELPTPANNVRIENVCRIPANYVAQVTRLTIRSAANEYATKGKLILDSGAKLIVSGMMRRVENNFTEGHYLDITDPIMLNIADGATLVIQDSKGPAATVGLHSIAHGADRNLTAEQQEQQVHWQYIAIPVASVDNAMTPFYGAWMYAWDETMLGSAGLGGSHWQPIVRGNPLEGFQGYAITQDVAKTYNITGKLNVGNHAYDELTYTPNVSTAEVTAYPGFNLIGNSYTAPIDIKTLGDGNFSENIEKTIYIYNTGSHDEWNTQQPDQSTASQTTQMAGQYLGIPINVASYTYDQIAPMQAFYLLVSSAAGGTESFSIDYLEQVYQPAVESGSNTPLPRRAPRQNTVHEGLLTLSVSGQHFGDEMRILVQDEEVSHNFDNGWDARKIYGDPRTPQIFAMEQDGEYSFNSIDDIIGQRIAVVAGNETNYTLRYDAQGLKNKYPQLYLHDVANNITVDMYQQDSYTFSVDATGTIRTFIIDDTPPSNSGTITALNDTHVTLKAWTAGTTLWVENFTQDRGHITIYDAAGRMVEQHYAAAMTRSEISLAMAHGVYTAVVKTGKEIKNIKIVL